MRSFDDNLRHYARLIIAEGVGLGKGQELIVMAEIDQAPFVRIVAEEAYKAGAKHVEVLWRDSELVKIRYREGSDETMAYAPNWLHDAVARGHKENAARLGILSADPSLLAEFPADRVATASKAHSLATKGVSDLVSSMAINWCLVGAASPDWAKRVFPNLDATEGTAALWDKIFLASRVLEEDPIQAWIAHSETLEAKVRWLDSLHLDALHFQAPGTDLKVGLVEKHLWAGGRGYAKNGITCSPNIPTEEVFTMPHRMRVDGVVSSTMPLSLRGQIVDEIRVEFKDGAAIGATAKSGEAVLQNLISTDEGANRLGEVALVPHSGKVGQTGTLFLNTLFDENAASHIAFGSSYEENFEGGGQLDEAQLLAAGANDSVIHVDWMIGSAEMDVDGIQKDGTRIPLMRSGEWV